MAYLTCPNCGITMFDRNPLAAPDRCPRCAARRGMTVPLERVDGRHGAAASMLGSRQPKSQPSGEEEAIP